MSRVLVVDDRDENRYYLKALFEGNGYTVDEAANGAVALERARAERPDLVVSDLLMPEMDGYTLLSAWREDAALAAIPFVVYTATYTEPEDRALALSLGADAFIVKPAEPEAFMAAIGEVETANRREPARPGGLREGGEHLETYSRVLVRKLEQKMLELEASNRLLQKEIAEREHAQDELERRAALQRIAGRAANLGGWSYRVDDDVFTWSDEICSIYDLGAGHAPTLDEAAYFCAPDDRRRFADQVRAAAEGGDGFDFEVQVATASGRTAWLRWIGEAVAGEGGGVVRLQGAVQDISDRKRLEERVLCAQRMESIATLTGGIAHDLNNVLQPVVLAVELLKDQIDDADALDTLTTVESCAQRGMAMVSQVLSFARGVGRQSVRVEVAQVVRDLERFVRDTFPATTTVRSDIEPELWPVEGDATQVHQVLLNLLVNARDAMPEGGEIAIRAENVTVDEHYAAMSGQPVPGPHVRLSVVDPGVGMAPDVVGKIFEPLFTTKAEGRGTGIGLSTVSAIVRDHGGFVTVYSDPGAGTTFHVHLPASAAAGSTASERGADRWRGDGELVLVVDDEAAVRSIARHTLEAFGYRVLTATDGADALRVFRKRGDEIDLVVTDLVMPVMDGTEAIRRLRALRPDLPIIATSGVGAPDGDARAREVGAGRIVPKPYTADELLSAIESALSAHV